MGTHYEPNYCILSIEPKLLVSDCNRMVLRTPNKAIPLHRCFRRLSFTFYLNYCVCYKYITALLRLHTICVLHGGARRPRGRLAPFIRGPSCPIHTSADFFTFTHNPLISLPFSMKVIENVYSCKCISTSHWLTITR